MYHYVHDQAPGPTPTPAFRLRGGVEAPSGVRGLTAGEFRAQLDRLCELLEPIDWPTFHAWMSGRGSIPHRCVLLTFDDGLADHAKTVLPILEACGMRGVFFVPGAVLASHRMLPAHALHLLLSSLDEETLERELLRYVADHKGDRKEWAASVEPVDTGAARALYHYETPSRARLKYLLTMALPLDLRADALDTLFRRHVGSPGRWAQHWYLGWDDLARMQSAGHTIGGHGFAHEPYPRLTPARRREDLREVAAILRNGLGPDIRPFCYPYGQFDNDSCAACRDAGFAQAFTTQQQWVTHGIDLFRLPRVDTVAAESSIEKEMAWASS